MQINWQLFHPLGFQAFCRDLLCRHLGTQVEAFPAGPDGGVDGRAHDGATIIQCKRYTADKSKLYSALKEEARKERVQKAERYILLTTLPLTPADKDKIRALLPNIRSVEDVLGNDDIEGLVARYPDIRKLYPQLWLGDEDRQRQLLREELDKGADLLTLCEWEKMVAALRYVAEPPLAAKALSILREKHVLIITGKPGIGKTTLAYYLIWHLVRELEYTFVYVSSDIDAAFQKFDEKKKQIFLYDDFLGANFMKYGFEKNEDKRLPLFLNKVAQSPGKLAVFTTREFIFRQALSLSEHFRENHDELSKMVLEIKTNENAYKAQILYNHLWFQQIPYTHIERLFTGERGERWSADCPLVRIIGHAHFNPRIIASALAAAQGLPSGDAFPAFVLGALDNPYALYETAFTKQLSELEKRILLVLGLFPSRVEVSQLEAAVLAPFPDRELPFEETYTEALNVLVGDFLTSSAYGSRGEQLAIDFANPGVRDFINTYYARNITILRKLIGSALYAEQLISVYRTFARDTRKVLPLIKADIIAKGLSIIRTAVGNDEVDMDTFPLAEVIYDLADDEYFSALRPLLEKESAASYPCMDIINIDSYAYLLSCYEEDEDTDIDIDGFIEETFDRYEDTEVFHLFDAWYSFEYRATRPYTSYYNAREWEKRYLTSVREADNTEEWEAEVEKLTTLRNRYPQGIAGIRFSSLIAEIKELITDRRREEEFYALDNDDDDWQRFAASLSGNSEGHTANPLRAAPAPAAKQTPVPPLIPPYLSMFTTLQRD